MIIFKYGRNGVRLIAHGEPKPIFNGKTRFYFEIPRAINRSGVKIEISTTLDDLKQMIKDIEDHIAKVRTL